MKRFLLLLVLLTGAFAGSAQTKGIQYQAVIQDPNPYQIPGTFVQGQVLQKGKLSIRFSLKSGNLTDFEEIHDTETDEFGLINLTIGHGKKVIGNFDDLTWNGPNKQLIVAVKINGQAEYAEVSRQTLQYSPYALYADAVEYKNVYHAPKDVSHFSNDAGYLIANDLKPLEQKMNAAQAQNEAQFTLVKDQQLSLEKRLDQQGKTILETIEFTNQLASKVDQQGNQIVQNKVDLVNQINGLGMAYENLANKSTAIDLGNSNASNQLYPTQRAVKTYVDQVISNIAISGTPDATTLAPGKLQLAGDLAGTATNPTVPGLASKENTSNKSTDVSTDGTSDTKYPSVHAVKTYVDQATQGIALSADLNAKADKNSPIFTGTPQLPSASMAVTQSNGTNTTQIATTAFVQNSIAALSVNDASSAAKGILQLSGDLGGTASSPTVPALASKENLSNKSTNIQADANSTIKYPSVKTIKDYIDNQINSSSVSDASSSVKGIIQLTGDLSGLASSPTVANNAITTLKLANGAVTDAKIDQVSGSKIIGNITGNASNITGVVSPANGGSGTAGTLTGYVYANGSSAYTAVASIPVSAVAGAQSLTNKSTAIDLGNATPSDVLYPSQKAVKTYVDQNISSGIGGATQSALNMKENSANKSDDASMGPSTILFPTQNAVKNYVEGKFNQSNIITLGNLPLIANGTVLGNISGSTSSPTAINTTGSGNVVRASNATITSPVLNGTISGTSVLGVANGGLGTNTMTAGYVKAGNPFVSISSIPVSDVLGAVQKVNGITPDANGNVAVLHGTTYTGTYNGGIFSAVANPTNSDIYIVSADPTPTNNGRTFIYDGIHWNEISTDQAALDARYVRLSGGNMGGNLSFGTGKKVILQDAPSADTDAVNKAYVDNTVSTGGTPDASSTTLGKIKLTGDSSGTASNPAIASAAINTLKIADGAVTDAKITGVLSATKGGTGVDNSGKTLTLGGNLVLSGAFPTNLTISAATSLNLPTSGTLSTLTGTEALTNKTVNGIQPNALGTGFSLSGGSISKTLTVSNDASISGTNTGDQTITLSGAVIGSGTGSISTTLADNGVVAGNYGSATSIPVFTVDSKGRISSITSQNVSAGSPVGTSLMDAKIWIGSGSNLATAQSISGDISLTNGGVTAIGTGKVTNTMLAGSIDLSTKMTGILPVTQGGTGLASIPINGVMVGAGTGNVTSVIPSTGGQVLTWNGTSWSAVIPTAVSAGIVGTSTTNGLTVSNSVISLSPADGANPGIITTGAQTIAGAKTFTGILNNSTLTASKAVFTDASKNLSSSGILSVDQGGTGLATLPLNGVLIGNGTNGVNSIIPSSSGQVLTWNGTSWSATIPTAVSAGILGTSTANGLTVSNNVISLSPADATNPGIVTTGAQTIAGAKTFTGILNNSTLTASKAVFTDASKNLSSIGIVGVDQGGTGASSLTAGALLTGNGTSGILSSLSPSTAGYVLKVVGTAWTASTPDRDESDQFSATVGQTSFTLTQTPLSNSKVKMFINGIRIDKNAYTLSNRIITYIPANNSSFTLIAGDRIQFDYAY